MRLLSEFPSFLAVEAVTIIDSWLNNAQEEEDEVPEKAQAADGRRTSTSSRCKDAGRRRTLLATK